MVTIIAIIIFLVIINVFLIALAVMQIKMAGIEVKDFWYFIKANDTLNKLYSFSKRYEKLTPQQQIMFLQEADIVFDAFGKVPNMLWEEDYDKYMEILNKYKDIRLTRWEESSKDE